MFRKSIVIFLAMYKAMINNKKEAQKIVKYFYEVSDVEFRDSDYDVYMKVTKIDFRQYVLLLV